MTSRDEIETLLPFYLNGTLSGDDLAKVEDWLANDPAAADPVCRFSPHHERVKAAVAQAEAGVASGAVVEHPLVFRDPKESRRLAGQASS